MIAALALCVLPLFQDADLDRDPPGPGRTVLPEAPVVMEIDRSSGWPVVEVMVAGRGPYAMILDTGAMGLVLNADLAAELELEVTGTTRMGDPSNPQANEVDLVALPFLQIGDALFEDLEAVSWERSASMQQPGLRGIVGLPVFRNCLLTLDYEGQTIRIEKGALPEPDGGEVIAFERDAFGAVTVPLHVAGEVVDAHIDSGNAQSLVLPKRLEGKAAIVAGTETKGRGMRASGAVDFTGGVLDGQVSVGAIVMDKPDVRFDSKLGHANLGRAFLQRCALTIDQANLRLRMVPVAAAVPATAKKVVDRGGKRRLEARMMPTDGGKLAVVGVGPGSLGERAGLQAGDVLLEVDGVAVTFSDASALTKALGGDEAFTLTVERDGKRVDLKVPAAS